MFAHAELVRNKKVGIGRASVYRILGAEQAHDIKMMDRLSRWGSRKTAWGWIMGRRNRHGRSRAHLREVSEDFEQDWQDERDWRDQRDEVNVEEIADNRPSDGYIALQAEAETLRTDLQAAQAKVATLEAACRARWATSSFIMWLFATAATFGAAGYIARILT